MGVTRIHDWQRIYRTGHTYMGTSLWAYVDRTKPRVIPVLPARIARITTGIIPRKPTK